ncbi:hypothetical protein LOK49_LG08G01824 [Camellia lanceoleosa]|uniref:Uncharacterized protein n=1 Tax=Camellia lanceoleosa TaxID=1840588 RepID=A0ACC0GW77_9ERIC|nr:hypothetical protein LOK49_LG08G01824 [Camellia lanceoleosa]
MVLVLSIYEPCGLAQMIGMRYGAFPTIRKTGGLAFTAFDMDDELHAEMANGSEISWRDAKYGQNSRT